MLPLSPGLEDPWRQLETQLEWAEGPWLGWVFGDTAAREELITRSRAFLTDHASPRAESRNDEEIGLRRITVNRPEDVEPALLALLATESGSIRLTWVVLDAIDDRARQAWLSLHLLLNERRERLFRRQPGGVLFASGPDLALLCSEGGPDLWTMRSLLLFLPSTISPFVPIPPNVTIPALPEVMDVRVAIEEFARLERSGEPQRYLFALAKLALSEAVKGDLDQADDHARRLVRAIDDLETMENGSARMKSWLKLNRVKLQTAAAQVNYVTAHRRENVYQIQVAAHALMERLPKDSALSLFLRTEQTLMDIRSGRNGAESSSEEITKILDARLSGLPPNQGLSPNGDPDLFGVTIVLSTELSRKGHIQSAAKLAEISFRINRLPTVRDLPGESVRGLQSLDLAISVNQKVHESEAINRLLELGGPLVEAESAHPTEMNAAALAWYRAAAVRHKGPGEGRLEALDESLLAAFSLAPAEQGAEVASAFRTTIATRLGRGIDGIPLSLAVGLEYWAGRATLSFKQQKMVWSFLSFLNEGPGRKYHSFRAQEKLVDLLRQAETPDPELAMELAELAHREAARGWRRRARSHAEECLSLPSCTPELREKMQDLIASLTLHRNPSARRTHKGA